MTKVVLDTNVIISAIFWKGAPYEIYKKVLLKKVSNFISYSLLGELDKTLTVEAPWK